MSLRGKTLLGRTQGIRFHLYEIGCRNLGNFHAGGVSFLA